MFNIIEVLNKKQMKEFVNFPNELYKNCPHYVPPFHADEIGLNSYKKNPSLKDVKTKFFLCVDDDNKVVGRVCAILQPEYNKKTGVNYVRFTRLDFINDIAVSKMLIDAVKYFAIQNGMDTIHGPLGFNDLDREGMVVEGFDCITTFANAYNYDYYMKHLEVMGFVKEADWLEHKLYIPEKVDERYIKLANMVGQKYGLREYMGVGVTTKDAIKKYDKEIFKLINECYGELHGFIQITDEVASNVIGSFAMAVDPKYLSMIVDKDGKLIAIGIVFSSIARSLQKCKGKLFPFGFMGILKELKHPKILELAIIAVADEYKNKAVHSMIFSKILPNAIKDKIVYAETNSTLEDNYKMRRVWKGFDLDQHRRRRCYVLHMNQEQETVTEENE